MGTEHLTAIITKGAFYGKACQPGTQGLLGWKCSCGASCAAWYSGWHYAESSAARHVRVCSRVQNGVIDNA